MVRILSDKNGNSATGELLEEMGRLHAEIDRLRKIIDSIKSVLGTDVFESTTSRYNSILHGRNILLTALSDKPFPLPTTITQTVLTTT